jgi:hypothetical protein
MTNKDTVTEIDPLMNSNMMEFMRKLHASLDDYEKYRMADTDAEEEKEYERVVAEECAEFVKECKSNPEFLPATVFRLQRRVFELGHTAEALKRIVKPRSDQEIAAIAAAKAKATPVFAKLQLQTPEIMQGEPLDDYRVRLATKLKQNTKWGKVKLSALAPNVLDIAETQIYGEIMNGSGAHG